MADFERYAKTVLARVYEKGDDERIYRRLCDASELFRTVSAEKFAVEYLVSKLALVSLLWARACAENGIRDEKTSKVLLKTALELFRSRESSDMAALFSEYLYAQNLEDERSPVLAVARHLFKRLGLSPVVPGDGSDKLAEGFETAVALYEAYKSHFENAFFEFAAGSGDRREAS